MKKLFWLFSLLVIAWSILLSPLTVSAQSDDEFWDFSTTIWEEYDYETTQEDAQWAAWSFIRKLDFFWATLLSNTLLYWYYYPSCFTAKEVWSKTVIYAKPAFCYPKGANKNAEKIQISELKIQDLMDWKYKVANQTLLILIPLLFSVWLIIYILMYRYDTSTWSNTSGWNTYDAAWWMNWMSMSRNTQEWSLKKWWWSMQWRIWGWFIEKIFWKNDVQREWEEEEDNSLATKVFAFLFLLFLVWSWNALSLSLSSSIPIYFDWWFKWIKALYWIWVLYLLSYFIFLALIFVLIKFSLLSFIRMDVEKKENVSVPIETFKLIWIAIVLLWAASLLISNFWVQLFSILLIS